MKHERTFNRFWPAAVFLAALLSGGVGWGVGAILFENPASKTAYTNKLGANPEAGRVLKVHGTDTNRAIWTDEASGTLPSGATPGQVLGATNQTGTVVGTGTYSVTGTWSLGTSINTWSYAVTGTAIVTGSATGTEWKPVTILSGATPSAVGALPGSAGTATDCSPSSHKHHVGSNYPAPGWVLRAGGGTGSDTSTALGAGWENPFSTSTPVADGTSGANGTGTSFARDSHQHQGDGNDKASAYTGAAPGSLYDTIESTDGYMSISVDTTYQKLNINPNVGSSAYTLCAGNDSRLSNARTPTAHASTHLTTGSDPISLASGSNNGLLSSTDYTALSSRTSTPGTASRIVVSGADGMLTPWVSKATQSADGAMSKEDKAKLDTTNATPQASVIPVSDSSGELTGWVKVFKGYSAGSCSSNYSIAQSTWTTVASIPCTISGGGAWFITGLVQFLVTTNDYIGIRFTLDSTDIALSDRLVRVIRDLSSYVYSSINTTAIIPISDSNSHTCNLQVLRQAVANTMTVNCSSDTNQFARISAIKMYK